MWCQKLLLLESADEAIAGVENIETVEHHRVIDDAAGTLTCFFV